MILEQFRAEKLNKSHGDPIMTAIIIMLAGFGLAALFSVTYQFSLRIYSDPLRIFKKQLFYLFLFIPLGWICSRIKMQALKPIIPWLVLASFLLLLVPFLPGIGIHLKGGSRWIDLGPLGTLQPSELAKPIMILYLGYIVDKKGDKIKDLTQGFIPPVVILTLFSVIIFAQRDYSTALFLFTLGYMLLFMGGVRILHLVCYSIPLAGIGFVMIMISPHALDRVKTYLGVIQDPQGAGYQIEASLNAFSRGGWFGRGLGINMIEGSSVPEAHSDFILPAITEEVGFAGIMVIFALIFLFSYKGFRAAWALRSDRFLFLTASGITIAIVFQAFINIGVAGKMLPTTGIPLPFFSAGGSSLLVTILMAGILIGLSGQSREVETG